jgi:NADPH:quinone reductase-like Zn-dependent oxidoreductase
MKAVRVNQWGQPITVDEAPQPVPASDEVLVRVRAASINPVDVFAAASYLKDMQQLPLTVGTDFAGDVVSVGADVTHVKVGDAVYGMIPMRGGAFAEYTVVKGNEVARKPQSLNYEQAAAVPLTALSAYQTLVEFAQVKSGERVLIHGAAGATGSFAVQLAKSKGAYVIANANPGKEAYLKELGVDEIINAQTQRFEDLVGTVNIVLNFASNDLQERSYNVLKSGGRYATAVGQPDQEEAARRDIRVLGAFTQPTVEHLTKLAQIIDAGELKVLVKRTFPLADVQDALQFQQSDKAPGKIVLTI